MGEILSPGKRGIMPARVGTVYNHPGNTEVAIFVILTHCDLLYFMFLGNQALDDVLIIFVGISYMGFSVSGVADNLAIYVIEIQKKNTNGTEVAW